MENARAEFAHINNKTLTSKILRLGCSTEKCLRAGNNRGGMRLHRYGIVSISVKYFFEAPFRSASLSAFLEWNGRKAKVTALAVIRKSSSVAVAELFFPEVT
jgi:hypothetical protein